MSSSNGIDPFIGCFIRTVFGRKKLLTRIQHCRRLPCCFVGGEARCGYPPGYKTGARGAQYICSGDAFAARVRQPSRRALERGNDYITGAHL